MKKRFQSALAKVGNAAWVPGIGHGDGIDIKPPAPGMLHGLA